MERVAQGEGCVAGRETEKHARLHRADRESGRSGEAGGESGGQASREGDGTAARGRGDAATTPQPAPPKQ